MINEVLRSMETGLLAEVGLVAFLIAFTIILIRTLSMSKRARDDAKQMPLDEIEEIRPSQVEH